MLKVENLTAGYSGRPVIDGMNFTLPEGEKWVIVGQNGSGKTTLFRSLLGLMIQRAGTILYDSIDLRNSRKNLNISGNLPECYRLLPMNCRDIISAYGELKKFKADSVIESIKNFGLGDILSEKSWKLSTGQQKLFYGILALAGNNDIAILDEPFENIDFQRKKRFVEIINGTSSSVILSTHDSSVLELMVGWKMYLLLAGKLFGPLDPTVAGRYHFNPDRSDNAVLQSEINGKPFSITVGEEGTPITSIEKISSIALEWAL